MSAVNDDPPALSQWVQNRHRLTVQQITPTAALQSIEHRLSAINGH